MKSTLYIILTIFKIIIIAPGMVVVTLNLMAWFRTKDSTKIRKAAFVFAGVVLSIFILSAIEFVVAFN